MTTNLMNLARVYLQANLSTVRYHHSLNVCAEMELVAPIYGLDLTQAMFSGLLHDVAKEIPKENMENLVRDNDPDWWQMLPENCRHEMYLHDPAGAVLAKRLFPGLDPVIVSAIRNHVLNDPDLPLLTRCLRVADMVRPAFDYDGRERLQDLFHSGQLDHASMLLDAMGYMHCRQHDIPILPVLVEHHAKLEKKAGVTIADLIPRHAS